MHWITDFFDLVLHLDEHLLRISREFGTWTYGILFAIVFLETGVVVTPFLPGDSLLFAAGALAATGALDVHVVFALLVAAAILGDNLNYAIGTQVGPRVFRERFRFLKRKHLDRTQRFYERHGGKTVILARFAPILRTFAPFVAGIGRMRYPRFLAFDVTGGIAWVGIFVYGGYLFGNLPWVKSNFTLVILAIIALSLVPVAIEVTRGLLARGRAQRDVGP